MMDYAKLANRYGYTTLFGCKGSVNQEFVDKLDAFFLSGGKLSDCSSSYGDNRRIIEYLDFTQAVLTQSPKVDEDMKTFDKELACLK